VSLFLPPLPPTFEASLRDVGADAPRYRLAAARELARPPEGREDEAADALLILLSDPLGPIRAVAAGSLGELPSSERVVTRLREALSDPHREVRELALESAARLDPASEWLLPLLDHDEPELRFAAVVAVAERLPERARVLRLRLEDEDAAVRAAAARALAGLGHDDAADAIAALLGDIDFGARVEAALALSMLDDPRGEGVLCAALEDRRAGRRFAIEAAEGLGRIGTLKARESLAFVGGRFFTPLLLKAATGAALARLGDPRGTEQLDRVLRARRADGRDYAVQAAGELGLVNLLPALRRLVTKLRGADPLLLARALERMASENEDARRALDTLRERLGPLDA